MRTATFLVGSLSRRWRWKMSAWLWRSLHAHRVGCWAAWPPLPLRRRSLRWPSTPNSRRIWSWKTTQAAKPATSIGACFQVVCGQHGEQLSDLPVDREYGAATQKVTMLPQTSRPRHPRSPCPCLTQAPTQPGRTTRAKTRTSMSPRTALSCLSQAPHPAPSPSLSAQPGRAFCHASGCPHRSRPHYTARTC